MDAEEVRRKLVVPKELKVSVEPSNIAGSPYDYVFIFLGKKEHEGAHIIISDAKEMREGPGFTVGAYHHFENAPYRITTVHSMKRVQQVVNIFIKLLGRGDLIVRR